MRRRARAEASCCVSRSGNSVSRCVSRFVLRFPAPFSRPRRQACVRSPCTALREYAASTMRFSRADPPPPPPPHGTLGLRHGSARGSRRTASLLGPAEMPRVSANRPRHCRGRPETAVARTAIRVTPAGHRALYLDWWRRWACYRPRGADRCAPAPQPRGAFTAPRGKRGAFTAPPARRSRELSLLPPPFIARRQLPAGRQAAGLQADPAFRRPQSMAHEGGDRRRRAATKPGRSADRRDFVAVTA